MRTAAPAAAAQFHGCPSNVVTSGCSSVNSSLRTGHRERADHADAGQPAFRGVQAEQQRADRVRAALVHPVAGHHAVRGPLVLDLEHGPLVRLVAAVQRLGDQPVQPGPLELAEPPAWPAPGPRWPASGAPAAGPGRGPAPARPGAARTAARTGRCRRARAGRTRRSGPGSARPAGSPGWPPGGSAAAAPRSPAGGPPRPGSRSRRRSRSAPGTGPAPPRPVPGSSGSSAARCGCRSPPRRASRKMIDRKPSHFGSKLYAAVGDLRHRFGQHRRDGWVDRQLHAPILHERAAGWPTGANDGWLPASPAQYRSGGQPPGPPGSLARREHACGVPRLASEMSGDELFLPPVPRFRDYLGRGGGR